MTNNNNLLHFVVQARPTSVTLTRRLSSDESPRRIGTLSQHLPLLNEAGTTVPHRTLLTIEEWRTRIGSSCGVAGWRAMPMLLFRSKIQMQMMMNDLSRSLPPPWVPGFVLQHLQTFLQTEPLAADFGSFRLEHCHV
uniref:(northern house mosquito) hypothetical protein n=1 Tax=Culex pipiens TaxID=7175 RepID=A0A8D8PFL4_CULPI